MGHGKVGTAKRVLGLATFCPVDLLLRAEVHYLHFCLGAWIMFVSALFKHWTSTAVKYNIHISAD